MKKTLLLLGIALFSFGSICGQGSVKIGATGGLLNTNADVDVSVIGFDLFNIDAVNKTGFYIGLVADIEATEKFHIQPELTYGSAGDYSFFLLPIMAKLYVIDKLHVQAGPQFSFSTNLDEIKDAIRDIDDAVGANSDLDDVLNSTNVEIGFGAGYDINENFGVQARYAVPLTDIYDGPLGGSLDIKNSIFQLGIVYMF